MGLTDPHEENPYVGPRPFEREDRNNFFGRDREVQEMLSLVIAHRVVLLYAASGTGKTSLLDAALLPLLERSGFAVLPLARLRGLVAAEPSPDDARNVYTVGVLSNWVDGLGGPPTLTTADRNGATVSLADFVRDRRSALRGDGRPAPIAMVIDQFEELFTLYPDRWRERSSFVENLADALDEDRLLRIVLAIREDYLAQLDPLADTLPDGLRTRFRLERLGRDDALTAVTGPLRSTTRSFASGVAASLVDDLLKVRVDRGRTGIVEVEGEFVEPVQLQVACHSLWSKLHPDADTITKDHLRLFGDVDTVLARFYDEAVDAAATRTKVKERRLRERLERGFITPLGTRSTVFQAHGNAAGIPDAAIAELENRHLIRAEARAGARWYELTHDRLIEPIRASNRQRLDELRKSRNRRILIAVVSSAVLAALVAGVAVWQLQEPPAPSLYDDHPDLLAEPATVLESKVDNGALSPDGTLVAATLDDDKARVWDAASGRRLSVFDGHEEAVRVANFSPDGTRVVTASDDQTAQVWDARTGGESAALVLGGHEDEVFDAEFDSAGRRILTVSADNIMRVWDAGGGKLLKVLANPYNMGIDQADFNRDGTLILTNDSVGSPAVWNPRTGKLITTLETAGVVNFAEFSPDGALVLTAGGEGDKGITQIWRPGGKEVMALREGSDSWVSAAAMSPDGKYVATVLEDGSARLWDVKEGTKLVELRGHDAPFLDAADVVFSPDGTLVVTGSGSEAAVWDVPTGELRAVLSASNFEDMESIEFSDDGAVLLTVSGLDAQVWKLDEILH